MEPLLSQADLARLLGRAEATLEKDRLRGSGPPFVRVGRLIRYRPADVRNWLDRQVRRSTTDPGAT